MEDELSEEFEIIILGTGFTESLLAAASARIGKRVLHLDRNPYYGSQWASFSLKAVEEWISSMKADKSSDLKKIENDGLSKEKLSNPNSVYFNVRSKFLIQEKPEKIVVQSADLKEQKKTLVDESLDEKIEQEQENIEEKEVPEECIKAWSKEELLQVNRKFNLDLAPKLLFSRGPMVELLISSNVARYVEFKCLTRILTYMKNKDNVDKLLPVPCSRSDVFTTNVVSLIEKRLLMKFLQFCHRYKDCKEEWESFGDKPFVEFLKHYKLTPTLLHFVISAIAMVDDDCLCSEGLEKTSLFLNSLGRYGSMPFLFSLYGSGEMPQAFCRLCAVFEGVYMLRKDVEAISINEDHLVSSVVSEGQHFRCKNLVIDSAYAPNKLKTNSSVKYISRAVFVTDRSICPADKENLSLLRIPSVDKKHSSITVLEFTPSTGVCCKDTNVVHMTSEVGTDEIDAEVVFKDAVANLFSQEDSPEDEKKPKILFQLYFNQVQYKFNEKDEMPSNLYVCSGPNADLDYDRAIEEAKYLFSSIFPGEAFLPRAPDPEEIVFEGDRAKEGDNFEEQEVTEDKETQCKGEIGKQNELPEEEKEINCDEKQNPNKKLCSSTES